MKIYGRNATPERWDRAVLYFLIAAWGFIGGLKVMHDWIFR